MRRQIFHFFVVNGCGNPTIDAGFVQGLPSPLKCLISNGFQKDSVSQAAVLDDVKEGVRRHFGGSAIINS